MNWKQAIRRSLLRIKPSKSYRFQTFIWRSFQNLSINISKIQHLLGHRLPSDQNFLTTHLKRNSFPTTVVVQKAKLTNDTFTTTLNYESKYNKLTKQKLGNKRNISVLKVFTPTKLQIDPGSWFDEVKHTSSDNQSKSSVTEL